MLSGGATTEAQLLEKVGEWTSPEALADALGKQSVGFNSRSRTRSRKPSRDR